MFTGLIEAPVPVRALAPQGSGARLILDAPDVPADAPPWDPRLGESLSVSGCCLTLIELGDDGSLAFDLSAETLSLTWFGDLEPGRRVNIERSVRLQDRLGGHLVSGHVDGVGTISAIEDSGDGGQLFTFDTPDAFARYLVPKGSVSVDGISLTIVDPRDSRFDVAIIPETLVRTSLGTADVGQRVHLEADQIGKWVERLLAYREES